MSIFDKNDMRIICENEEFDLLSSDHVTICENNYCYRKFVDDVVAERFASVISSKMKFRI